MFAGLICDLCCGFVFVVCCVLVCGYGCVLFWFVFVWIYDLLVAYACWLCFGAEVLAS